MPLSDCCLTFERAPIEVDISERGMQSANGLWGSTGLVEKHDIGNVHISLDGDGVTLHIGVHHVENEDTDRAFHATLEAKFT